MDTLLNTLADRITGVSIDTRTLCPGNLFVALPGTRVDGHDFLQQAQNQGAVAALVEHPVADCSLEQHVVPSTQKALQALSVLWRQRWQGGLVAVTGSNGKTTVKEMTAAALGGESCVLATRGNLNNHLGVPLTLCRLQSQHQHAVIEMGANHPGEIAALVALARPRVAVITQAGAAHLEGFGSVAGVAAAKGEILDGLDADGVAVLNADDAFAGAWRDRALLSPGRRVLTYGFHPGADVRCDLESVQTWLDDDGFVTTADIWLAGQPRQLTLRLAGQHNVHNALAALAVVLALGASIPDALARLALLPPVKGRMQPVRHLRGGWMIHDAYNANPTSLLAALEVVAALEQPCWLLLGAFAELGDDSEALHVRLGEAARIMGVERLYATGEAARHTVAGFGTGARFFAVQSALTEAVEQDLQPGVLLLVKGSRSQAMERVVAALERTE